MVARVLKENLIKLALLARDRLGLTLDVNPDPEDTLIRARIAHLISGYTTVSDGTLAADEGRWESTTHRVVLGNGVLSGSRAAGFTVFHELAHALLRHDSRNRRPGGAFQPGRYTEEDEENADALAAMLMVPPHLAQIEQNDDGTNFAAKYGIPQKVASSYVWELRRQNKNKTFFNPLKESGDLSVEDEYGSFISNLHTRLGK